MSNIEASAKILKVIEKLIATYNVRFVQALYILTILGVDDNGDPLDPFYTTDEEILEIIKNRFPNYL
jgi:hypothetical protein